MTFVGGEDGLEEEIQRANGLRATRPEIARGGTDYTAVAIDQDAIYGVMRRLEEACSVVLVNLSGDTHEVSCALRIADLSPGATTYEVYDLWNEQALQVDGRYDLPASTLSLLPLTFGAFQVRVLSVRPNAR